MSHPRRVARSGRAGGAGEIVFVSLSRGLWGAETSLLLLARQMATAGASPVLICRSPDFAASWPGPSRAAGGVGLWSAVVRAAVRRRTSAIVCCSINAMPAIGGLRLLPRRPRLVLDLHYVLPTAGGRRKLALSAVLFDGVIAVSRYATEQLFRRPDRLVLYRPVSAPDGPATRTGSGEGSRAVGVVGRLDPDKHLDLIVDAVATLPGVQLVVRGAGAFDDTYATRLTARAEQVLGDRVRFDGRVPSSEVMDGLECLVVANHEETMGRTVAEAQLHRVPVVVPDRGGAAELVDDARTGRTFVAGDVSSLADAVDRALHDSDPAILDTAYDVASHRHDPARVAAAYAAYALDGTRP